MTDKVQKIKDWISKEQDGLMDAAFEMVCWLVEQEYIKINK